MNPARFASLAFALFTSAVLAGPATDLEPTLGQRGKLLLDEKFDSAALPSGWTRNTGELAVHEGALRSRERAADNHVAAFRKALPLQDCVIQLDVKLDGPATFHLGFDPAKGELKKQGHLFSLIIAPEAWSITEHANKADKSSKNKVLARAAANFPRGEWFTLVLEVKGDTAIARVTGHEPLRATAPDFRVKKPGLVFRVGGKADHAGSIDNVKVWELR